MSKKRSVHEPEAELLSAENAIQDAVRLQEEFRKRKVGKGVMMRVPLWALLEALDSLEPDELQQVALRARERLMATGNRST